MVEMDRFSKLSFRKIDSAARLNPALTVSIFYRVNAHLTGLSEPYAVMNCQESPYEESRNRGQGRSNECSGPGLLFK
jgi:hypothetical protein